MWGHLSKDRVIDVLEGAAAPAARAHAESCARCREAIDAARGGLELARPADVPEPSPLYWEAFRRQVDRRLDDAGPRKWRVRSALVTAAALAAVLALVPASRMSRETGRPATLPAWSALPPLGEDASFALLEQLDAAEEDLAAAWTRRNIAGAVADLSESERQLLAEALQAELLKGKS